MPSAKPKKDSAIDTPNRHRGGVVLHLPQITAEIKPPSILLRHNICYRISTSVVGDNLVEKITAFHALEFGNRAGVFGSVQRDIIYSMVRGLSCISQQTISRFI
jgi:hypothetical protein